MTIQDFESFLANLEQHNLKPASSMRVAVADAMLEARKQLEKEPVGVNTIKAPTLIMWGREDAWIPLDVMERFKKDMPHARVIVYDGAGHVPMEEIPEITAKDADDFLSGR